VSQRPIGAPASCARAHVWLTSLTLSLVAAAAAVVTAFHHTLAASFIALYMYIDVAPACTARRPLYSQTDTHHTRRHKSSR